MTALTVTAVHKVCPALSQMSGSELSAPYIELRVACCRGDLCKSQGTSEEGLLRGHTATRRSGERDSALSISIKDPERPRDARNRSRASVSAWRQCTDAKQAMAKESGAATCSCCEA